MQMWWNSLARRARITFSGAALAVFLLLGAAAWWLLRSDPAVLFSDLRPQDAASLSAELDKLKIPYAVAGNGATLLVDRAQVHSVRLKLMGRDLPLHGTVGLELFNTTDFGMTEFAQKVNFQRALQGELTRTILSFPEVADARVHLALPDQGLFRQNAARPTAAITLNLRHGQSLRTEQVGGIQRLVAAAVPGLAPQQVTILDQQGVGLSRAADGEADGAAGSGRLELKRETEAYLGRKAAAVLDQAFGRGQALASVDVTLNMDQVRVTTEDVIPAPDGKSGGATGVLIRERESARDNATPDPRSNDARAVRGSSMQRDVEYQAGRRLEQVVSQPGAIRRIHVVAVVRQPLEKDQQDQLKLLLAAAVGASLERGDAVVVQMLQPRISEASGRGALPVAPLPEGASHPGDAWAPWILAGGGMIVLGSLGLALRRRPARPFALTALTDAQREATLQRVQTWMLESAPPAQAQSAQAAGAAE
jgi:flagellar M-ring protein FliF